MSKTGNVPTAVLSRELGDAVRGRRVRAAVFTTFTFDPGFFELHILPLLFEQSFSHVDKVKRMQLEEAMRAVDAMAVYYDRGGLSQDAEPAQLDYRRIDVRRRHGKFHPKVTLLLVDNPLDEKSVAGNGSGEPRQSLIVSIASANLTRSGWWENVECAHTEEILDWDRDGHRCSFRKDLLSLIGQIRSTAAKDESHEALDLIHRFLIDRTQTGAMKNARAGGGWFTRLFCGQEGLGNWLRSLNVDRHEWNLEVISPYFNDGNAKPLEELIDAIGPKAIRVHLPRDPDGRALVTDKTYEAISELATWSALPADLTQRGRSESSERLAPRRVHAKVYRLWNGRGRDLWITGSANLTSAGTSHWGHGNLEACFLVDITDSGYPRRWLLEPLEKDPERFTESPPSEDEGLAAVPMDVSFRFDWANKQLSYRVSSGENPFSVHTTDGRLLFRADSSDGIDWIECPLDASSQMENLLRSTSFLLIRHANGEWRVLVREENMAHRPSLLSELTPEEILEYWSLLTADQRAAFVELQMGGELDGLPAGATHKLDSRDTLFDRFAGIYHAFGCLRRHVARGFSEERESDVEARMLGAKYDSLPSLLQKMLDQKNGDPVTRYVTLLCARQLRDEFVKREPGFFRARKLPLAHLDSLLDRLPEVRSRLAVGGDDAQAFLDWYEDAFLKTFAPQDRTA